MLDENIYLPLGHPQLNLSHEPPIDESKNLLIKLGVTHSGILSPDLGPTGFPEGPKNRCSFGRSRGCGCHGTGVDVHFHFTVTFQPIAAKKTPSTSSARRRELALSDASLPASSTTR